MFHLMIVALALSMLSIPGVIVGIAEYWVLRKRWKSSAILPILIVIMWAIYLIGYGIVRPDLNPLGNGLWDMVRIWMMIPITIGIIIGGGIAILKNRQGKDSGGT